jgi:hypothetical protein
MNRLRIRRRFYAPIIGDAGVDRSAECAGSRVKKWETVEL